MRLQNRPVALIFKGGRFVLQNYKSKRVGEDIKVLERTVQLPKLGFVKGRVSKQVWGRILSATVSRNPTGMYFVSLCCTDVERERPPSTGGIT